MKRMIVGAAMTALLAACANSAAAQTTAGPAPSARQVELARELVEASGMRATLANSLHGVLAQVMNGVTRNLPADQKSRVQIVIQAEEDVIGRMAPQFADAAANAYARTYSEQELSDLLVFYHSPSGRAMLAKTPQLTQAIMSGVFALLPQMRQQMGDEVCAKMTCTPTMKASFYGAPAAKP